VRTADGPPEPKAEAAEVTRTEDIDGELDLTGRQRQLRRLEAVGGKLERSKNPSELAAFESELERFVALSECRVAVREGRPTVATGLPFGEYGRFGQALAEVMTTPKRSVCVLPTDGSAENVSRVSAGDVAFGVVQGDVAAMAHKGSGLFEGEAPLSDLRAVCALFPEAVQIVARADLNSATELKGLKVGLGPLGSGSRASARRVLASVGIPISELAAADARPTGEALDALVAGELDAVFVTGAWPLGGIADRAVKHKLTLLSLPPEAIKTLTAADPSLVEVTLAANTYPGLRAPRATVAVTATLVTSAGTDDKLVTEVLDAVMGNGGTLAGKSSHSWYTSKDKAQAGRSIPLHPAAQRYLAAKP
jgi:TRAP transporter TAXI family solute receptor